MVSCWRASKLLNGLKCEFKQETMEEQGVGVRSLARSILEGYKGVLEFWDGTRKNDKLQLLTWTCTKPTQGG
jgi:hypothetical protein